MHETITADEAVKKKSKLYFPNLNGVRAIAALMVVVSHIELHKVDFHIQRLGFLDVLNFGKVGVTIFFSLSGFLITYLLLEEKRNFSKVNFKDFYIRRILRIWPLYYLIVIIGFFIYPHQGTMQAFWLSVLFLPNLAFRLHLLPLIFDPIWSIGTEEQFYIFHPHFFRIKKLSTLLSVLLSFILFMWVVELLVGRKAHDGFFWQTLDSFLYYARFDNMMIGAVIAVLYFNTKHAVFAFRFQSVFNFIFNKYVQVILLLLFWIFVIIYLNHKIAHGDVVLAFLAALLIVNLCETETSIYSLKSKRMQFVGQISYGIYLLHKFPLFLTLYLADRYIGSGQPFIENSVIYGGTILATLGLASLSYYGFEKHFLTFKKKFQKITQN